MSDGAPSTQQRRRLDLCLVIMLAATGCAGRTLEVVLGPKTAAIVEIDAGEPERRQCTLSRQSPGSGRMQLEVAARTPCRTKPGILVHVFRDDAAEPIATIQHTEKSLLVGRLNTFKSGSFGRLPSGTEVTVQVHAGCLDDEKAFGESVCRIP